MNYLAIERCSINNGTGIRLVLWVSGCEHGCVGCQNPHSHDYSAGKPFTEQEVQQIMQYLENDYVAGITFSGGDPLAPRNRAEIVELAKRIKAKFNDTKNIWCYTGYTLEQLNNEPILGYIDVLVDGRFDKTKKDLTLKFRGSSNQRILYRGKDF